MMVRCEKCGRIFELDSTIDRINAYMGYHTTYDEIITNYAADQGHYGDEEFLCFDCAIEFQEDWDSTNN